MNDVYTNIFNDLYKQYSDAVGSAEQQKRILAELKHVVQSAELTIRGRPDLAGDPVARSKFEVLKQKFVQLETQQAAKTASDSMKGLPESARAQAANIHALRDQSTQTLQGALRAALESEQAGQSASFSLLQQRESIQKSLGSMNSVKTSLDTADGALQKLKKWWQ